MSLFFDKGGLRGNGPLTVDDFREHCLGTRRHRHSNRYGFASAGGLYVTRAEGDRRVRDPSGLKQLLCTFLNVLRSHIKCNGLSRRFVRCQTQALLEIDQVARFNRSKEYRDKQGQADAELYGSGTLSARNLTSCVSHGF